MSKILIEPKLLPSRKQRQIAYRFNPDLLPLLTRKRPIDFSTYAESAWGRRSRESIVSPSILLILVFCLLVVLGLVGWIGFRPDNGRELSPSSSVTAINRPEVLNAVMQFLPPLDASECSELLRDSDDQQEMLKLFEEMKKGQREQQVSTICPLATRFARSGVTYHPFEILFSDGNKRLVAVIDESGEYSIDWDAYCRTPLSEWQALLTGSSKPIEVRVNISAVAYYNYLFSDDLAFESIRMESPDLDQSLYGYAHRGSQTLVDIAEAVRRASEFSSSAEIPVTLVVESVGGSYAHRQFLITDFVADGWIENGAPITTNVF